MSDLARAEASNTAAVSVLPLGVGERVRNWAPLALVIATFLAVSTVYNLQVPLYEAPDEIAHARNVRTVADEGKLPGFKSSAEYESWQPPLYYVLGAAVLKIGQVDSPPELPLNPDFNFPTPIDNFLHSSDEDFPYSEPALAVHMLRGISTLFGAGTILFIYLTALVLFPGRRLLAFAAGATAALIPQFAFISATVSNDPPSFFFAAGTAYFGLRHLRDANMKWLVLAALMLSLGLLTKLSALVAGAVPLGAVLLLSISLREKVIQLAILIALPLVIAGWFYLRSLILWGAIFPDDLFYGLQPHPIWHFAYRRVFLEQLQQTFWYAGGPATIRLSPFVYDILNASAVLSLGGVIVAFAGSRLGYVQRWGIILLSLLPLLAVAMLLYYGVEHDFQTQGRYLFIAMPAFAILIPFGLSTLLRPWADRDHPVVLAFPALLLAINISIFTVTLPRYY